MDDTVPQPDDSHDDVVVNLADHPPLSIAQRGVIDRLVDQVSTAKFLAGAAYARAGSDSTDPTYRDCLDRYVRPAHRRLDDYVTTLTWWLEDRELGEQHIERDRILARIGYRRDLDDYGRPDVYGMDRV